MRLDAAKAPCTVNSLMYLAGRTFYDGTSCHRLGTSPQLSVLQCGDPTGTGSGGPSYRFADENKRDTSYKRGTVAMANAGADSNGSQFFIVYKDIPKLSTPYTIFGTVTSGMDIVDRVAAAGATNDVGNGDGRPKQKITFREVRTAQD
ncbi:peptidylprolyl isomerase [Actinomadura roseirufa]|uniref:peptidylprolyl isomerase n=1 Tax=Actinomadura roseirufa TaxID=2094049 RepID=UPI001F5F95C9|nr:peptidylprolyl isomerase [Actinomadura roseirufa]